MTQKDTARKNAVAEMRNVLVKRRDALRKALAGDLSSLNELNEQTGGDAIDAALDSSYNELSSQLAEVESRELAHIENALERMREGSYGHCENCGTKIPMARLKALPYATFCINCQRLAELEGDMSDYAGDWGRILDSGDNDVELSLDDIEVDVS